MKRLKNYLNESRQFKKRIIKSAILIIILISFLIVRLVNLQIINYKKYASLATSNQLEYLAIEPNRGLIYDRNGILLAENIPSFSLNITADRVKNLNQTIADLQSIINITPSDLQQLKKTLHNYRRYEYIPIKNKLSQEEIAAFYVNQYQFPGVTIATNMTRHYPLAEELAHAVGYVGRITKEEMKNLDNNYSINNFIGKTGIEKYYESTLRGKTGYKVIEVGATGKLIRTLKVIQPIHGKNIHLTIDSKLQQLAKRELGAEKGAVVAIDPRNGEILALVSNPSFDPNLFAKGIDNITFNQLQNSPLKPMYNRATKGSFPFASTIKPFIALQALETGLVATNFRIDDPGWFKLERSSHIYHDWNWRQGGHGIVNIKKAIMVSCDVFFYTISLKVGIAKIAEILTQFGFGNKIGIDLAEESAGIVSTPEWKLKNTGKHWYLGDTVISSIGQGFMSATPLQLAQGVATIAMRGQRFTPHLLASVQNEDGIIEQHKSPLIPTIKLKNDNHWQVVIDAMRDVISNPEGTAYYRFGEQANYSAAGKTGEAQLYRSKSQDQSKRNVPKYLLNHNLFIAFAPVENPEIAVAVISENSNLAVKTTRKILDYWLLHDK